MKEIKGNIWDYYDKGNWIIITTNGTVKSNGEAVMGRGVALEAKIKFPDFSKFLGNHIQRLGNIVSIKSSDRILTFPVKHNWYEKADMKLIEKSCKGLTTLIGTFLDIKIVYLVRPGCGNGQLNWKDVKSVLEKYLDDRFVVVNNE